MENSSKGTISLYFASLSKRFLAMFIDGIILSVISRLLFPESIQSVNNYSFTLLYLVYATALVSSTGQTIGKALLGVKVVNYKGQTPDVGTAFLRSLSSLLSGATLFAGYLWAFFNGRRQTWHDLIAKTYVVDVPASQDKYPK